MSRGVYPERSRREKYPEGERQNWADNLIYMADELEKRGPVEKTKNGWPINPFGVVVLIIFILLIVFLVGKPLLSRSGKELTQMAVSSQLISPVPGEIIKGSTLTLELSQSDDSKVTKVEFWAKTYVDNNWEIIGEVPKKPFKFDWQIPPNFQNKAIAVTTHVFLKDGNIVKDPGGWREGIIILSQ